MNHMKGVPFVAGLKATFSVGSCSPPIWNDMMEGKAQAPIE